MIRDPQTSRPPIVAGDVTGKGLKETMLVALVVGAIRMAAEINSEPLFWPGRRHQRHRRHPHDSARICCCLTEAGSPRFRKRY